MVALRIFFVAAAVGLALTAVAYGGWAGLAGIAAGMCAASALIIDPGDG